MTFKELKEEKRRGDVEVDPDREEIPYNTKFDYAHYHKILNFAKVYGRDISLVTRLKVTYE